jgi:hypothetical protein
MTNVSFAVSMLSVAIFGLPASAQDKPKEELPWRDVEFRVGLFSGSFRSGVETTNALGAGFALNLEDTLDLDDTKFAFRIEGSVALGDRHRIHLEYLDVFREGEKNIERDIEVDGVTFPLGASLRTESSMQLITLTYGYSILQDDRMDLALTFGIHGLRTELELEAATLNRTKSLNVFLPVPLPGLRFDAVLSPGVWLRQRLDFIWLDLGDYGGLMADYGARLEVELGKGFTVAFGFNTLNVHIESRDDDNPGIGHEGSLDYDFSGLLLYAGYSF